MSVSIARVTLMLLIEINPNKLLLYLAHFATPTPMVVKFHFDLVFEANDVLDIGLHFSEVILNIFNILLNILF